MSNRTGLFEGDSAVAVMATDAEIETIGYELERAFTFQGKNLTKAAKIIWVQELSHMGIPPKAVIEGIKSLKIEELRVINYATIREAALGFMVKEDVPAGCDSCMDGMVMMVDPENRSFCLGCECDLGARRAKAMRLKRWSGEDTQFSHGRMLRKRG